LLGQLAFVVRVELRIVAATGHCDIRQTTIHEFFSGLLGVDMDEHAVGGLALTAVATRWKTDS
jgi:hypothetical protein